MSTGTRSRGLIFARRVLDVPALQAFHEDLEVRAPSLRLAVRSGRNVTTDYALVDRAVPFTHHMQRPQISILLAGEGRADEKGRRVWVRRGTFLASDGGAQRGGIMAYGGAMLRQILLEWDPRVFGAPFDRDLDLATITDADCARLEAAASRAVEGHRPRAAITEVLAILASAGVPFARVDMPDIAEGNDGSANERLYGTIAAQLSALERFPGVDDFSTKLGWDARTTHRRIADLIEAYALPWSHWRSLLHSQRIMDATRLLAAPGATTELVARVTGFRAPTALCHAFAKAGLPSPGTLARAARRAPLDDWTQFARGS